MALLPQWISKLVGTTKSIFQIGGPSGVSLKNNSANVQIKNAADSAFTAVEVDSIKIIDPANTARNIDLSAPTLGASYALTLPSSIGLSGDTLVRDGSSGTKWTSKGKGFCCRRVDITNANPVFTDTKGSTLKLYGFNGTVETLWNPDTAQWEDIEVSTITIDMSSTGNQVPFCPHDIFEYIDPSTHTSVAVAIPWQSNSKVSITNVTNASPPVVTVGSGHGFAVNDFVVIQSITGAASSLNNRLLRVGATTSTTISLQGLDGVNLAAPGAYTSGGTATKASSQTTPQFSHVRYSGYGYIVSNIKSWVSSTPDVWGKLQAVVCYGEELNSIYDYADRPFVNNVYNKLNKVVSTVSTGTTAVTWTPDSTNETPSGSRAAGNNYGPGCLWLLIADIYETVDVELRAMALPPGVASENTSYILYVSKDSVANYDPSTPSSFSPPGVLSHVQGSAANSGDRYIVPCVSKFHGPVDYGLHKMHAMEFIHNSGTNDWSVWFNFAGGTANQYVFKGGFWGFFER